ncbi:MAG: DUF835 domain-containing protein [Candidatus Thermoplasmatota archaeon]
MCLYVPEWKCNFAGKEISIEICKTCIEAKKVAYQTRESSVEVTEEQAKRKLEPTPEATTAGRAFSESEEEADRAGGTEENRADIWKNQKALEREARKVREEFEEKEKSRETKEMEEAVEGTGEVREERIDEMEEERGAEEGIEKQLEKGAIHLLGADEDQAYDKLEKLASPDKNTLCITRKHPEKLDKEYDMDVKKENYIWLSTRGDALSLDPTDLQAVLMEIEMCVSEGGDLIFLSGLDYLMTNNEQSDIVKFFQEIEDQISSKDVSVVVTLPPYQLEEEQFSWIEEKLDYKELKEEEEIENEGPVKEIVQTEPAAEEERTPPIKKKNEEIDLDEMTKREALKELDEEFHKGEISADEYISKRAVLTEPISEKKPK